MGRPVIARTVCQSCGAAMRTEYVRLGVVADCPGCLRATVPIVPEGGRYPAHGYEITYGDFRQLLEYHEYCQAVAPLLAEWFGYAVADTPAGQSGRGGARHALGTSPHSSG